MGADDGGGGSKPQHATKDPCDDHDDGPVPCHPFWSDHFNQNHLPRVDARPQPPVVAEPRGYVLGGKILLAAAGALAGVLLALVAMYIYNAALRRRRSVPGGGGRRRLDRSPAIVADGSGGEDRYGGTTVARPRGLDPAVLRALPVVFVPAASGAGADCAVCLAELRPGEKARALPRCVHLFHADCIDAWFRGNATCPLCRADVVLLVPEDGGDAEQVALPEVRVDVAVLGDAPGGAKPPVAPPPAMGRLPSGTDLDKTRRAIFASTRSVSF